MNNALIPIWIIGAPLLLAIIDWIRTPKVPESNSDFSGRSMGATAPTAAR